MAINQAQLADLRTEYRREIWKGIQTPEWQRKIVSSMVDSQEPAILRRIAPHWKLPKDPAILARFRGPEWGISWWLAASRACGRLESSRIESAQIPGLHR